MLKVEEAPVLRKSALLAFASCLIIFFLKWTFLSPLTGKVKELETRNKNLREQIRQAKNELDLLEKRVKQFSAISAELASFKNSLAPLNLSRDDLEKITELLTDTNLEYETLNFENPVPTKIPGVVSRTLILNASTSIEKVILFLAKLESALHTAYPSSLELAFPADSEKNCNFTMRLKTLYRE